MRPIATWIKKAWLKRIIKARTRDIKVLDRQIRNDLRAQAALFAELDRTQALLDTVDLG